MQYNITYREKDKGIQYIISYKDKLDKWKQKSKQGFTGKREAKAAAQAQVKILEVDIELKSNLSTENEGLTFKDFSKMFAKHKKLYNSYKTVQSTETVLNKFSSLNDIELSKITVLDIQKIVDTFTKEGLNPNTIKYYIKKLTIIFNAAKNQYNIISAVPTKNIRFPKSKPIIKKALNENEVDTLLSFFKNTQYYLLIFIAVNTGMRIGEILGLTWDKIDLLKNEIIVDRQWKKNKDNIFDFGELKTANSKRNIPISKDIAKVLKSYRNIDNRVLEFKNKDSLIAIINRVFKANNFEITFHELRHTYGTKLIANGMDFKTAAELLGHDVQETIKTYSHVNDDMRAKAKKLIEDIF